MYIDELLTGTVDDLLVCISGVMHASHQMITNFKITQMHFFSIYFNLILPTKKYVQSD